MQEIILQMTVYVGNRYVMQAMAVFDRVASTAADQAAKSHWHPGVEVSRSMCGILVMHADRALARSRRTRVMAVPARKIKSQDKVTINADGEVNLPEEVLRAVDWKEGDRVWVTVFDDEKVMLTKRPADIVAYFAGALTHLYPEPGDIRRFLDEERASWVDFDRRFDD